MQRAHAERERERRKRERNRERQRGRERERERERESGGVRERKGEHNNTRSVAVVDKQNYQDVIDKVICIGPQTFNLTLPR
jgi:hypothetical protein